MSTLTITNTAIKQQLIAHRLDPQKYQDLAKVLSIWSASAFERTSAIQKDSPDRECLLDCGLICAQIETLLEGLSEKDRIEIYLCEDLAGNHQAAMAIQVDASRVTIMELVTNPWNIASPQGNLDTEHPVKGAGTSLVLQAIKRARELNTGVYLKALPLALKFYEKLGFSKVEEKSKTTIPMILQAQKIRELYSYLIESEVAA
jgi:hypothetical protein